MKRVEFRPPLPVKYEAEIAGCGRTMGLRKPKSIKHNGRTLAEILEAHERFFRGKDGGARGQAAGRGSLRGKPAKSRAAQCGHDRSDSSRRGFDGSAGQRGGVFPL